MVPKRARAEPHDGERQRGRRTAVLLFAAVLAVAADDPARATGHDVVPGPVPARVVAVIDGDTITVRARIWIGQDVETRVRLSGVDAPELRGACPREKALARDARALVVRAVDRARVTLSEIRHDKFGGRVVARVRTEAGEDLATLLVAAGLGRAYDGGKRRAWCDSPGSGP